MIDNNKRNNQPLAKLIKQQSTSNSFSLNMLITYTAEKIILSKQLYNHNAKSNYMLKINFLDTNKIIPKNL